MFVHKTKDYHSIPLENWDNYLKKLYDFPDSMCTIWNTSIKEDIFSMEDIESMINKLAIVKAKYIVGYQAYILKMGKYILIHPLHKLLNP